MKFYQKTLSKIYQELDTNPLTGLTSEQAEISLLKYGNNELKSKKSTSIFSIFFLQFADPLIYLLVAAAGIIFIAGQSLDAFIIGGILMFNAVIGTIQEKRTEKILDGLQSFFICESVVIRNSIPKIISSKLLVPGDIIHLSAGEKIPADARLITSTNLTVDESMLTGESTPANKFAIEIQGNVGIADQVNILFSGTHIISGQATAVIFGTGKDTQVGTIHKSIESINTNTPLKQELEYLSTWILAFAFVICTSLFIIGLITHKPIIDLLVMLTALFICVVPEGLPVVITLVLISGAYKMAQRNVLVKHLKAVEALGRVNVIITDKTGTLTRNEMIVTNVFVDGQTLAVTGSRYFINGTIEKQDQHQTSLKKIAYACALLNDTTIDFDENTKNFNIKGDPTQAAAFVFAQKISQSIKLLIEQVTSVYTIPFDSIYKYKAIFYHDDQSLVVSVIGAPEVVLAACSNISKDVSVQLEKYLSQGSRVIALAQKTYKKGEESSFADYQKIASSNLTFLGLIAISDEPRENLFSIIQHVHDAGIQIIMATGDHRETALYVAKKVGIVDNDKNIMTGQDFAQMSDEQAIILLQNNFVCARFSPQDKLRLVHIFHQDKKIVATTGDGINDVPALVASDISIAMGNTGTQLTQQASDIILLQDSFENIVYAIQQGRNMFKALRRTVLYFLTSNTGEVLIVFFALIINIPLPLLPSQILWLNLITDGFLDVALAMEPEHDSILLNASHEKNAKIFDANIMYKMLYLSLPMSLIGLGTFLYLYKTDLALARTLTLVTLAMFQWFNAFNCRSETKSIFQIGLLSNFWLLIATLTVLLLELLVIYVPFMQQIFNTVPLSLHHWIYAVGVSSSILIIEESRKYITQRFFTSSN